MNLLVLRGKGTTTRLWIHLAGQGSLKSALMEKVGEGGDGGRAEEEEEEGGAHGTSLAEH